MNTVWDDHHTVRVRSSHLSFCSVYGIDPPNYYVATCILIGQLLWLCIRCKCLSSMNVRNSEYEYHYGV